MYYIFCAGIYERDWRNSKAVAKRIEIGDGHPLEIASLLSLAYAKILQLYSIVH